MDRASLPLAFPPRWDVAGRPEHVDRAWWMRTVVPWAGDLVAEWELQPKEQGRGALIAEGEALSRLLEEVKTPWFREREILVPRPTRRLLEWAAGTSDALVAILTELDARAVDDRHRLSNTGLALLAGLAICATIRERSAMGALAAWDRILRAA